jgi:GNAT superfamily N-acetyltransferase
LVAELQDLYVTPDARGDGVGTALIEDRTFLTSAAKA